MRAIDGIETRQAFTQWMGEFDDWTERYPAGVISAPVDLYIWCKVKRDDEGGFRSTMEYYVYVLRLTDESQIADQINSLPTYELARVERDKWGL